MNKEKILKEIGLFSLGTGGIGNWLTDQTENEVFDRLATLYPSRLRFRC